MTGRYRALLIGNSSYPADEHNLQALKGPVKDIAVLNRALADAATGLFADAAVTLLPEATSARAIRALGRFFGTAERDDVLLFYFSGHGKLDQASRLHLCMQDTETTDLLATAVSSARLSEFADSSHARSVVIVLDCCFSGAFRGGDPGDAVAGPGRYVLTSCRSNQLANDATVDNGTSHFTQHLVDGLLGAAVDHDGDGYVTFSDLYAYVDRQLRRSGKQIPQRRVQGDGDLFLAKRPPPARAPAAGPPPGTEQVAASSAGPAAVLTRGSRPWPLFAASALVAVVAAGTTAGVLLSGGGNGGSGGQAAGSVTSTTAFTFKSPWRLKIANLGNTVNGPSGGCSLWLIDARSGKTLRDVADGLYGTSTFQVSYTGTFRWRVNDRECEVVPLAGTDSSTLPFDYTQDELGDTPVFAVPTASVTVRVIDWSGNVSCDFWLHDAASGQLLDFETAHKTATVNPVNLKAQGHRRAYLEWSDCGTVHVSAGP